jgi:VIT1/CCC1 family predicted Fe2+/Mn2+ transporter
VVTGNQPAWHGVTARLTGAKPTSRHRNLHGNALRAAVLGAGDGLLTNVSLVLGVAAASTGASFVRLAGVAGLLAGAFSMAAGELVSVRAQDELKRREIDIEAAELRDEPEAELRELAAMYRTRGVPAGDAMTVARILSANHELALDTHARLELGIDPGARGSSVRASLASFFAFAFGAVLPLLPWFFLTSTAAIVTSIVVAAAAAAALGATIGVFTGKGAIHTAVRQLAAATVAAGITYSVGAALGVHT